MMLIPCPWCGLRNEDEFHCGGEAGRRRPGRPDDLSDLEWSDYLYNNENSKGWVRERWWHHKGCNRWFEIERNNVTHEIRPI
ncbi:MAG: sarcosine oxidase subunit delta [Gammaproteobacteria bacterium]|nr:sarcosine oxidase subunit delta [Gammaproteobacteria bacterium]